MAAQEGYTVPPGKYITISIGKDCLWIRHYESKWSNVAMMEIVVIEKEPFKYEDWDGQDYGYGGFFWG